ncbi:hypothetical protein O181_019761 [Austropuccinia psidii MF-1]|uniref:Uncharacterized protein n=1 Tax=Austropuccinia psidii MF-1 TaxID=1389203 RepID=A0A9Q3C7T3_9BASI|nr:hypothetical protein [Austropuccinia psidii MF-1]
MQIQNSPPAKNTRSQRHQAVLTPTGRATQHHTPSVHQLSANLDRGPPLEGDHPPEEEVGGLGEVEDEEGEEYEETDVAAALEVAP